MLFVSLFFGVASASSYPAFASRKELKLAVNKWCDDRGSVESKYGPIGKWDVSLVDDFSNLFCELAVCVNYYDPPSNPNCIDFNEDISAWDTSRVESMTYLFAGARAFNQPLTNWDTSKVKSMMSMFDAAESFNQPVGHFDTSRVETMSSTFRLAKAFNQPSIQDWDTSNVQSMRSTFHNAASFNQPLPWNTRNVTEMKNIFAHALAFDQPLDWDVSNVNRFEGAFLESKITP